MDNYIDEYYDIFYGNITSSKYWGYYVIQSLSAHLGLDFEAYSLMFYIIAYLILLITIRRMTDNVNFVLALYSIFPFGVDAIQMKTLMANVVMLLALSFILNKNKSKYNILIFVVLSSVSVAIHFSTIIIMILGIVYCLLDYKEYIKGVLIVSIVALILSLINIYPSILMFISQYITLFDIDYLIKWFEGRMGLGIILIIIEIMLLILSVNFNYRVIKKNNLFDGDRKIELYKHLYVFIWSALVILPIVMYNIVFDRLIRCYAILMYILMAEVVNKKLSLNKLCGWITTSITIVMLYWMDISHVYDITLGAMLKYNSLTN
jgi:hypothetical protein